MRYIKVEEPVELRDTLGEPVLDAKGKVRKLSIHEFVLMQLQDKRFLESMDSILKGCRIAEIVRTARDQDSLEIALEEADWALLKQTVERPSGGVDARGQPQPGYTMYAMSAVGFMKAIVGASEKSAKESG